MNEKEIFDNLVKECKGLAEEINGKAKEMGNKVATFAELDKRVTKLEEEVAQLKKIIEADIPTDEEIQADAEKIFSNENPKNQDVVNIINKIKTKEKFDDLESRVAKLEAENIDDEEIENEIDEAFKSARKSKTIEVMDLNEDKTLDKNPKINLFISQPMTGFTNEEILEVRERAIDLAKYKLIGYYHKKIENTVEFYNGIKIIDNTQFDLPADTHPLEYLANDIRMLKDADYIYFCEDWENSKGCNIEFQVAKTYGIKMIFE